MAAVSSNYILAELGYMVLATFDTVAYHLFEMKYKNATFFFLIRILRDLLYNEYKAYDLMYLYKISSRIQEALETTNNGSSAYYNKESGEVVWVV